MNEQALKQQLITWLDGNITDQEDSVALATAKRLINKQSNTWPVLLQYKESQWEAWFPLGVGARIFNYLHPQQDDATATGAINELISGVKRLIDDSENLPIRVKEILAEDKEIHAKFSTVSSRFMSGVFSDLGITPLMTPDAISSRFATGINPDDSVFTWDASKEDSVTNRNLCNAFLTTQLLLPVNSSSKPLFFLHDVTGNANLLNTNFGEREAKGTTDFVVSSYHDIEYVIEGALILFEFHKQENTKNKMRQAQLELLSGDKLSSYNIITVLTDLQDSWKIFWFQKTVRNLKGYVANLCSCSVSRVVALGFLRYHLKVLGSMLRSHKLMVDVDDADDNEGYDDDDDKEEEDKTARRRNFLKTTPTYQAVSVANIKCLLNPGYVAETVSNMTNDELSDKLIWNLVDRYRGEIARSVEQ